MAEHPHHPDPLPPLDSEDELALEAGSRAGFALGVLRRLVWTVVVTALCVLGWYLLAP